MIDSSQALKVPSEKNLAIPILRQTLKYGSKVAMRCKREDVWQEITWSALKEYFETAAKALLEIGLDEGQMVSIFSPNMPECTIVDVAALSIRGVPVYIYPASSVKNSRYIVQDSDSRLIFAGTQEQYDKIVSFAADCPSVKKIVVFHKNV